ncbi:VanW family protein [Psychrobacillus sp. FSL K6-2836]|uniref:VanW family protein n=1 Tax=Psychrobacillus sp. FSL K6-2836 TaxID=2921548 RepID=UPI0030F5E6BF
MEQKNSIQFFLLVAGVSLFLFVVTFGLYSVANAFTDEGGSKGYFDENTWIGPILVDGLSKSQATQLLTQETSDWSINLQSSLQFIFEESNLNVDIVNFLIKESIDQAVSGEHNSLFTQINQEAWETSISNLQLDGYRELIDESRIQQHILDSAANLTIIDKPIHITRYFKSQSDEKMLLVKESISLDGSSFGIESWIEKHSEVEVKADQVFSLNELVLSDTEGLYNAQFQNEVSSLLYKAALNSPFSILERHITTNNTFNREIGYEAFIDNTHDLLIKNEYGYPLTIESSLIGNKLTISIYSVNTPVNIHAVIDEKKELNQRVIVRPITLDQQERKVPGKNGMEANVNRIIFLDDSPWKTYDVAVDTYLPLHEVWYKWNEELLNLSGTSNGTTGDSGNGKADSDNSATTPPTMVIEDKGYEEVDQAFGDGYVGK